MLFDDYDLLTNLSLMEFLNTTPNTNFSIPNLDPDIILRFVTNRWIHGVNFYILACAYGLLISFGTIGNCLAVTAVIRKASMRTPRNMFIINLAVSDLLLCVVTMPLTFMEIVTVYWPLGNHEFLCKTVGSLQAISIFVSTISITAIALDRYHVIVYPTTASVQRVGVLFVLTGIWTLACLLSAPLFMVRQLKHIPSDEEGPPFDLDFCLEEWPSDHGRAYYSIFTIIIQYTLPITVVSVAYFRICKKLRYRMKPGSRTTENAADGLRGGSVRNNQARVRRTNKLLISIALIFGISWMPLNVYNLVVDLFEPFKGDTRTERIVYALCHLIGMSSANTNPLLYGFFNDNFRKEFRDIWLALKSSYCCCCVSWCSDGERLSGRSSRESRIDRELTATVHYRKSKASPVADGDVEQSTLITQVLDRQK